jgi:hypothetical protein
MTVSTAKVKSLSITPWISYLDMLELWKINF